MQQNQALKEAGFQADGAPPAALEPEILSPDRIEDHDTATLCRLGFLEVETEHSGVGLLKVEGMAAILPSPEGNDKARVLIAGQDFTTRHSVGRLRAALIAFQDFRDNESGATMIEYSLLAALVSLVAIGLISDVGAEINAMFNVIATAMAAAIA